MATDKRQPTNDDGDPPVTQAEFSTTMTAIKADLDQLATRADLEEIRGEMATKADLAKLWELNGRILELIEGIDQKLKPLQDLPERMERVERAIFP